MTFVGGKIPSVGPPSGEFIRGNQAPGEMPAAGLRSKVAPARKRMFNLFWVYPLPTGPGEGASFDSQGTDILDSPARAIPAIILYPALVTPEIITGKDDLELLLLVQKSQELTPENVNLQLRCCDGLDRSKAYFAGPLFPADAPQHIHIAEIPLGEGILKTQKHFAGLTDERVRTLYLTEEHQGRTFDRLYRIDISNDFLFTLPADAGPANTDSAGPSGTPEVQDEYIQSVLSQLNGPKIQGGGKYAFTVGTDDVDLTRIDPHTPIQAYHPVFYYESPRYFSFGHMADLHLCSRQTLLARSQARVVELQMESPDGTVELDEEVSPPVGAMMNICSRNVKQHLDNLGADEDVDIVLITGDLIDYIRSWYPTDPAVFADPGIARIWEEVGLHKNYPQHYQDFVDLISFYSLVLYFYDHYRKPVFVVDGNHDCYFETYGISPRLTFLDIKANPGIPADHNLTIYEAILAFGETYHEWKGSSGGFFDKELYLWFYSILTPFSDFAVRLPGQSILGIAWGEGENVLDVPGTNQGLGHLPRAKEALSAKQMELVNLITSLDRNVILISHFTYVNYDIRVPAWTHSEAGGWQRAEGWVRFPDGESVGERQEFGDYDFGTFSRNRRPVYWDKLRGDKIQLTLSGHSHRKGLYGIAAHPEEDEALLTRYYEFPFLSQMQVDQVLHPRIVVSDSAGPVPRLNRAGEFCGHGSDYPAASRILVDKAGGEIISIHTVPAVHAGTRPRLAVSIDYYSMDHDVFSTFRSGPVSVSDESSGAVNNYSFGVELNPHLASMVYVRNIRLYLISPETQDRLIMPFERLEDRWRLTGESARSFYYTAQYNERRRFLAVQFGSHNAWILSHYDLESWWAAECWIHCASEAASDLFGDHVYELTRAPLFHDTDEPDLDWRKENISKYR